MILEKLLLSKNPQRPGSAEAARQGIYWREIRLYGHSIEVFISVWFSFTLILPFFCSGLGIEILSLAYIAAVLIPANLSSRRREESLCEIFAIPKFDRFFIRCQILLAPPIAMIGLATLLAALDLPAWLWSCAVDNLMTIATPRGASMEMAVSGAVYMLLITFLSTQSLHGPELFTRRGCLQISRKITITALILVPCSFAGNASSLLIISCCFLLGVRHITQAYRAYAAEPYEETPQ